MPIPKTQASDYYAKTDVNPRGGDMTKRSEAIRLLAATFAATLILLAAAPIFAAQAPTSQSPESFAAAPEASLNWSGYAATGGVYTGVSATWTVPEVSPDPVADLSADTAWVGIGGVLGTDLIQAGTQAIADGYGRVTYQAWYEKLPDYSRRLPVKISPGDSVTVSINRTGGDNWDISFTNNSIGQNYTMSTRYSSSLSSAEWVVETPSIESGILPITDFGSVTFTGSTAVKDGQTVTLEESGATPIELLNVVGESLAVPSDLHESGSFTVTRTENSSSLVYEPRTFRPRSPLETFLSGGEDSEWNFWEFTLGF